MHLVVYFCGTGNPGDSFEPQAEYLYKNNNDVRTIFVNGCEQPEVCDSLFFPDLKAFAKRFTEKLFGKNNQLKKNSTKDLESIGIRIDRSTLKDDDAGDQIESITLCGYSRGAVTCFEVARQLNQIVPNIPVDIVADQPVPGNLYQIPGTNAASVADCSDLKNLKNVSVILGSYTGTNSSVDLYTRNKWPSNLDGYQTSYILCRNGLYYIDNEKKVLPIKFDNDDDPKDLFDLLGIDEFIGGKYSVPGIGLIKHFAPEAQRENVSSIHRGFFSQILPKLPNSARRDLIVIPRESHHHVEVNAPSGEEHMHMQIAKYLNKKSLISKADLKTQIDRAKKTYSNISNMPPTPFPPIGKMQNFFGLKKEEAYRYVDKLNPIANLRKGMMLEPKESLINWWKK